MKETKVMFEGIDSWNRPVFRALRDGKGDTRTKSRYGATGKLFPYGESEKVVLEQVTEEDLCYFGSKFDCEPEGYDCTVKIVKETEVPKELR